MNIEVQNLDLGYTQCESLNTLSSTKGEQLINSMESDISNLKNNWKGNDATVHINNLIKVHDALVEVVTSAKRLTSAAGAAMSSLQKVRNANGGSGSIGSDLPNNAPQCSSIQVVSETTEYYCKPSAQADYDALVEICTNFNSFKEDFNSKKNELMSNWTAGCDHETAISKFNEFIENSDTYYSILINAKENLFTAIENIKKVG